MLSVPRTVRGRLVFLEGGVHFVANAEIANCSKTGADCTLAALVGVAFEENSARRAGGSVFASDLATVRVDCSAVSDEDIEKTYSRDALESMSALGSRRCETWTRNAADAYGPDAASYAQLVRKTIRFEDGDRTETVLQSQYTLSNHTSGRAIPTIDIEVLDALEQGPAIGVTEDTVQAIMHSPDEFFNGQILVSLLGGRGTFTGVTGYRRPGRYKILIEFSEMALEDFELEIDVRECSFGEEAAANGLLCKQCSGKTYNFVPGERCKECPEGGICTLRFIRPEKGYWHRTPCSRHVQRCLTQRACEFGRRDEDLIDFVEEIESCEFDENDAIDYEAVQCRKVCSATMASLH